jgi:DNA-binding response OmpR family regulator
MNRTSDALAREADQAWKRSVRARVFVAEDDAALRSLVVWALLDDGHEVYEAASGDELLRLIGATSQEVGPAYGVDLVVLDHQIPNIEGLTIARKLRRAHWMVPLILMTSFPSDALIAEARELRIHLLAKPFSLRNLTQAALSLLLTETHDFARVV